MSPARCVFTEIQTFGAASISPASMPISKVTMKTNEMLVPFLDLPQSAILCFANFKACEVEDEHAKLVAALQNLSLRVNRLLAFGKETDSSLSETLQACSASLRTRMPLVLRQTKELVEGVGPKTRLVCKLRSNLALFRAIQYVDRIQEGFESKEALDKQLRTVLAGLDMASLPEDFKKGLSFRISPWVASVLSFDLPVGESAHAPLQGSGSKLPIDVEVEPVVEFRADDLASVSYAHDAARACKVTIVECKHTARGFCSGAGMIGEATIRVNVSPLDGSSSATKQQLQVWGRDKGVKGLRIKEARA